MSGAPLCIPAVSCALQSIPNLDSCCINSPSGHFLQTQFWDTNPPLGGNETWTIHGLWPDLCTGGFDMFCNNTRSYSAERITQILSNASSPQTSEATHPGLIEFMTKHWLSMDSRNSNLWAHEWNKHGTCISTLEPQCYDQDKSKPQAPDELTDGDVLDYFTHAVLLYTTLPTFDFFARHGIIPSYEETYELEHLRLAIGDSQHGREATFRCRNHNELSEVWYSFNVRSDLRNAMGLWWEGNKMWDSWVPADPHGQVSNCPATGIRYLPKDGQKHVPLPTATTHTHTATTTATVTGTVGPTARPFTGKGRLMVKVIDTPGSMNVRVQHQDTTNPAPLPPGYTGCIIRNGRWYASKSLTSCAIFTASDDAKSTLGRTSSTNDEDSNFHLFTLASRLAPCSFVRSWETPDDPHALAVAEHQEQTRLLAQGLADAQHLLAPSPKDPRNTDADTAAAAPLRMFFSCDSHLPFQSILSNNATIDKQHTESARRLTLGADHRDVFWAENVPKGSHQVRLWTDSDDNEEGRGGRKVKVGVFWEAI